jgi:putative restriction endonuclease
LKAVFDTRSGTAYDDWIVERYHFPDRYLPVALHTVGDWIVYREPRREGGRMGYIAVARVTAIDPDPTRPGHSYARVSDYLPFDAVVPLQHAQGFYEARLRAVSDRTRLGVALQGHSVRELADDDFAAIVRAGLGRTLDPANAIQLELDDAHTDPVTRELVHAPEPEQKRRVVQILMNRKIRDANFRRQVIEAYDETCAITRLKITNGGGKAEVQAAHIWSVADGGPDVVQNGIALTATAHWLFDRHLISLTDERGLLVSHNKVPAELRDMFERQLQRIGLPSDERLWPRVDYIRRHREAYLG